jgi:hypothetical protein
VSAEAVAQARHLIVAVEIPDVTHSEIYGIVVLLGTLNRNDTVGLWAPRNTFVSNFQEQNRVEV